MKTLSALPSTVRLRTHKAIKNGILFRPATCSDCGRRTFVEAHHEDYSQGFAVTWLCRKCHVKRRQHTVMETAKLSELMQRARGTWDRNEYIRYLHCERHLNFAQIGRQMGLSRVAVRKIVSEASTDHQRQ